jgi:hypothetical protein
MYVQAESVGGLDQIPWLNLMTSYGLELESLTGGDSTWLYNEMTRLVSSSDSTRDSTRDSICRSLHHSGGAKNSLTRGKELFAVEGPPLEKINFVRKELGFF